MTDIRLSLTLNQARSLAAHLDHNAATPTLRGILRDLQSDIANEEDYARMARERRAMTDRAVSLYRTELERRVPTGRSLASEELTGIHAPSVWDHAERRTFTETYAEPRSGRYIHRDVACYGDPREGDLFRRCDMVGKYAMGSRLFCEKHSKQEAARLALDDAKRQTGLDAWVALQDIIDAGKVAA